MTSGAPERPTSSGGTTSVPSSDSWSGTKDDVIPFQLSQPDSDYEGVPLASPVLIKPGSRSGTQGIGSPSPGPRRPPLRTQSPSKGTPANFRVSPPRGQPHPRVTPSRSPARGHPQNKGTPTRGSPLRGEPPPRVTPAEFRRSLSSPATTGHHEPNSYAYHYNQLLKQMASEGKDPNAQNHAQNAGTAGLSFGPPPPAGAGALHKPVACRITRYSPSASCIKPPTSPGPLDMKKSTVEPGVTQYAFTKAMPQHSRNMGHRAASSSPVLKRKGLSAMAPPPAPLVPMGQNNPPQDPDFKQAMRRLKEGSKSPSPVRNKVKDPGRLASTPPPQRRGVRALPLTRQGSDQSDLRSTGGQHGFEAFLPGKPPLPTHSGDRAPDVESVYDVPWSTYQPPAPGMLVTSGGGFAEGASHKSQSLKALNGEVGV